MHNAAHPLRKWLSQWMAEAFRWRGPRSASEACAFGLLREALRHFNLWSQHYGSSRSCHNHFLHWHTDCPLRAQCLAASRPQFHSMSVLRHIQFDHWYAVCGMQALRRPAHRSITRWAAHCLNWGPAARPGSRPPPAAASVLEATVGDGNPARRHSISISFSFSAVSA